MVGTRGWDWGGGYDTEEITWRNVKVSENQAVGCGWNTGGAAKREEMAGSLGSHGQGLGIEVRS